MSLVKGDFNGSVCYQFFFFHNNFVKRYYDSRIKYVRKDVQWVWIRKTTPFLRLFSL